ncbi:integrase core domain-containing protein [Paracoccus rhizosphaerae]|uniref:Integrase core domain-containing protein n=1 Tax=Paracoccus rhizosphaerae TaxID=1133347 RepID=A0ABV6CRG7_9RHOB
MNWGQDQDLLPTTGYCKSFNSKLPDELLSGTILYSLAEARVVIELWRVHYSTIPPRSPLGYRGHSLAVKARSIISTADTCFGAKAYHVLRLKSR